jgi:hypothetical protein
MYSFVDLNEEVREIFVLSLPIGASAEHHSLHVADGWAADSPVIENMIGYSRVHPVLKTLRRQSSELHLPFTLISAVEQTYVFLTQSEDVKPLLAAEQGEQGPDLESFRHRDKLAGGLRQQEISENIRRSEESQTNGPFPGAFHAACQRMDRLKEDSRCGTLNPSRLQMPLNFPCGILHAGSELQRIGNRNRNCNARSLRLRERSQVGKRHHFRRSLLG